MKRSERCKQVARMAALATPLCLATLSSGPPPAYPQGGGAAYRVQEVPFFITNASGVEVVEVLPKINAQGRVVGVSRVDSGDFEAARTDARAQFREVLGTLGGPYSDGFDI